MDTKTCTLCNQNKPVDEFYSYYRGNNSEELYYRASCKECERKKALQRANDPTYKAKRKNKLQEYRKQCSMLDKPVTGKQICTHCKQEKDLSEFYKDKGVPTGRNTVCKECVLKRSADRYYKNTWGIDNSVIEDKLQKQNGKCMICGKKTKLVLDHNHKTHAIRDLLCNHCNSGLGYFHENEQLLNNAIKYLNKHENLPESLTIKADPSLKHRRRWEL